MKTRQRNLSGDLSSTTGRSNTRLKNSENEIHSALPIPIDLVFEIFSRLPVTSIAICRCVSKMWASLLGRQDFTELFLSRSGSTLPKLLLAYKKGGELFFFSAPQLRNPDENSSRVVGSTYHMKLSFDAYFSNGAFEVSGLDQGLVGLTNRWVVKGKKYSVPVICNPSTGQLLPLTRVIKTRRVKARSMFGYDPIDKQVKVLSMSGSYGSRNVVAEEYQVMTLGTEKLSRRMIDCGRVLHYYPHLEGRCINGVLYYPSIEKSTDSYVLVCFDVRSENFSFVKIEKFLVEEGTMVNYNGKLGLLRFGFAVSVVGESSRCVNLWVLEDIEKQEWSSHKYVFPASWKDVVGNVSLSFVGMTQTKEIVMRSPGYPLRPLPIFYFNTERNTITGVGIQGINVSEYDQIHIFVEHVENVKLM